MSLGQKAKRVTTSQLHKLAEALMVMTVALGSWTKEVIADPSTTCMRCLPPSMTTSPRGILRTSDGIPWIAWRSLPVTARFQGPLPTKGEGYFSPRSTAWTRPTRRVAEGRGLPRDLHTSTQDDMVGSTLHKLVRLLPIEA